MQWQGTPAVDSHGYLYVPPMPSRRHLHAQRASSPPSPTNRSPARRPPRARSTPTSIPTAAATSPPATSSTAPTPPTAASVALHARPRAGAPLLLADRRQRRHLGPDRRDDLPLPGRRRQRQRHQVRRRSDLHAGKVSGLQHRPGDERDRIGRDAQRLLRRRRQPTPTTTSNGARPPPTAIRPRRRPATTPARPRARPAPPLSDRPHRPHSLHAPTTTGSSRPTAPAPATARIRSSRRRPASPSVAGRGGHRRPLRPGGLPRRGQPQRRRHDRPLRVRRRRDLPAERLGRTPKRPAAEHRRRDEQALPERQPVRRRAEPRAPLYHYRVGRHQRRRAAAATSATFRTFAFIPSLQRPLPQRPRAPADRRRAAARLPRLRAGLGRQRRRLRRRVRPGPGPDALRRLPAGAGPLAGPLRRPRRRHPRHRQPDQPRRRPLRGDPRRRAAGAPTTSASPPTTPSPPAPSPRPSPKPTPASTPSPSAGPTSARPASPTARPASRSTCPTAASSRAWPARSTPAPRPNRRASSASTSPPTAPTSSSARPPSSSPTATHNGDVSIYDRDLSTGTTHVVSKTPGGATMTGAGDRRARHLQRRLADRHRPARLNRRRRQPLLAPLHERRRLRPTRSTSPPARPPGVLYDGMTADGSKVYFTTADQLHRATTPTPAPTSTAPTSATQAATLTRVSTGTGGAGNTDSCDPAANTVHDHWNTVGPKPNCDVVAIGGGGGVASGDGTIYFLSPELLDGASNGVQDAPNLYLARPGSAPHFVAHPRVERQRAAAARQRTRSCAPSAPSPTPPALAIDHANGDVYVLDIGTDIGRHRRREVRLRRPHRDQLRQQRQADRHRASIGVLQPPGRHRRDRGRQDRPPRSLDHSTATSTSPTFSTAWSTSSTPSGDHIAQIGVGICPPASRSIPPTATSTSPAYSSAVAIVRLRPQRQPGRQLPDDLGTRPASPSTRAATSTSSTAAASSAPKARPRTTDSAGQPTSAQLDGEPLLRRSRSIPPTTTSTSTRATRSSSSTPPATRSARRLGSGRDLGLDRPRRRLRQRSAITDRGRANVASFGPPVIPSDPSTDNPLVVDSVSAAGTRNTADFQVTPAGDDAVFTSTLPLTGYDNAGHREVFRYDAPSDTLDCASCNPTGEQATGEATLAANGLEPHRRRPRLLQLDRRPGRPRPERQQGRL